MDLRQSEEHPFLGREIAQPRMFSQETAHEVDQAVRRLITEAEQKAAGIIGEHRPQIEHLVDDLEAPRFSIGRRSTPAVGPPESGRSVARNRALRSPDPPLPPKAKSPVSGKRRSTRGAAARP